MAALSMRNKAIFTGSLVIFVVAGTRFHVHEELVTGISPVLREKLAQRKGGKGFIHLPEVAEPTFLRFVEFAYTGDHNPGCPSRIKPEVEDDTSIGANLSGPLHKKRRIHTTHPRLTARKSVPIRHSKPEPATVAPIQTDSTQTSDEEEEEDDDDDDIDDTNAEKKKKKKKKTTDHFPLFLSHATLYDFAGRYGVAKLQELCATRLDEAWDRLDFDNTPIAAIISFIKHVHQNVPHHEEDCSAPGYICLRRVVVSLIARNLKQLQSSQAFRGLLAGGGQFPADLFDSL